MPGALSSDDWLRSVLSLVASLIAGLFVFVGRSASFAEEVLPDAGVSHPVHVGWSGAYFVGRWTPVDIDVEVAALGTATRQPSEPPTARTPVVVDASTGSAGLLRLLVTAPDPDGHRLTYSYHAGMLTPGRHQLRGFFKLGQFDFAKSRSRQVNPDIEIRVDNQISTKPLLHWRAPASGVTRRAAAADNVNTDASTSG